ncbi:glycoprotein 3-alpha-L-fucosyltransferase A-like [Strongylocentrotus purpuratus]|uniref:Fucosyltransferase n=1 Tax=Strongylocentrotus purpuratus TaxID=7668 RepID=A0A7M7GGT4_STRPU|nr:glycoprotein 3-alpha-L-fucosyltransferase A-like [Strongylocentrotus purpuratus]
MAFHASRKLEEKRGTANMTIGHSSPHPKTKPPSCFRQVQIRSGSKKPQKPQDFECPGLDCGIRFVKDTSFETMMRSDAVVLFHLSSWNWDEMQRRRPSKQVWVFFTRESPRHTGVNAIPPNVYDYVYNYTMTYRPSSSISIPYGVYDSNQPQVIPDDARDWAKEKTGMVVWMASNCHLSSWDRFGFVKELSRLIPVDIYGTCGKLICNRSSDDCWNRIRTYKFYLALENSECRDYITEKFWENSLQHDVVPIVYGAPKEDYLQVAPPKSFIHLQDFNSMVDLVDYLNLLNSNDTLYNSYFEWKRYGTIPMTLRREGVLSPPFLCKIVAKIRKYENDSFDGKHRKGETNPSIKNWWSNSCVHSHGFPHDF